MAARKGFQQCCISCIALFFLVACAVAAAPTPPKPTITSAKTGGKNLTGATDVTIIKENLTSSGEILIVGTADGGKGQVTKIEVSIDGGTTWKKATGKEQWQYLFTPHPNDTYNLILRVTNAAGVVSDSKTSSKIRLTYIPITLWELIQQRVDELAKTYMEIGRRFSEKPGRNLKQNGIEAHTYLEKARILFEEMGLHSELEELDKIKAYR